MWDHPFMFCVDSTFVRNCPVSTFLLPGTDIPHPAAISTELVGLAAGGGGADRLARAGRIWGSSAIRYMRS
jgi:hypothetical protein